MSRRLSLPGQLKKHVPRVGTFESAQSEPADHHQLIIIFIPGFKEIFHALQTIIAQWRKTEPFQSGTAHLKLFRCDVLAAGKSDKPFELEYWTSKVAEYMTRHEMIPPNRRRGSFENSTESEVVETQGDPSSSKPRKFVLVGHSLGCWIMRDLIVQHATQSIVMNTIAVYSLDAIKPGQNSERGAYTDYITAISERFNLRVKTKDYHTIEQHLLRVDQQFLTKLQYLQTANSLPNLIDESREVWLDGPIQRSRAKRKPSKRLKSALKQLWRHSEAITGYRDNFAILQNELFALFSNIQDHIGSDTTRKSTEVVESSQTDAFDGVASSGHLRGEAPHGSSFREAGMIDIGSSGSSKHISEMASESRSYQDILDGLEVAIACIENGDLKRADRLLEREERVLPQSSTLLRASDHDKKLTRLGHEIRLRRALIQMYLGEYGPAIDEFSSMMTRYPDLQKDAKRFLGMSYVLRGDYNDAVKVLTGLLGPGEHSSDHEVLRYTSTIQRDLATAHAYLGQLKDSREYLDDARRALKRRVSSENQYRDVKAESSVALNDTAENVWDSMNFTEATIDLIQGNYHDALETVNYAYDGMDQHLGKKHFRTLESAKLQAFLLALNSKSLEAEIVCRDAIEAMRTELGDLHPFTLETQFVLVYIFRTQSRFREAMRIGTSVLSSMLEIDQDGYHLRTLDARAELAMNHRLVGDYRKALAELEIVIRQSKLRYGLNHQSTLRYLSELAHVHLCCGYFEYAKNIAIEVLRYQRDLYSLSVEETQKQSSEKRLLQALHRSATATPETMLVRLSPDKSGRQVSYKSIVESTLEDIVAELELGNWIKQLEKRGYEDQVIDGPVPAAHSSSALRHRQSRLHVHPFLLHTLEVISSLIFETDPSSAQLAKRILEVVLLWKKKSLGERNASTLNSMYDLAKAKRDLNTNDLSLALRDFQEVYEKRCQLLGGRNPDSLAAKRELLVTICASETPWEDHVITAELDIISLDEMKSQRGLVSTSMAWNDVESCSQEILLLQEESLGKDHPQTLNTLLWVLVVQLDAGGQQTRVDKTADEALARLRSSDVRDQRLREALSMEERIACFYDAYDRPDLAKDIRERIGQDTRKADTELLKEGDRSGMTSSGV